MGGFKRMGIPYVDYTTVANERAKEAEGQLFEEKEVENGHH